MREMKNLVESVLHAGDHDVNCVHEMVREDTEDIRAELLDIVA